MRLLLLSVALLIGISTSVSAQQCLEYGPTVSVSGTLRSRVFPGPPNYESIKRGDRPETAIIVTLTSPTCTTSTSATPDDLSTPETDIREMQLVLTKPSDWKLAKRLLGKPVVLTGILFHAHTGHHRTKVLLSVSELKLKP
jgi:uncharacterized protein DUF4431